MAEPTEGEGSCRKRRGPYLQFLSDGSHQNVPRTTKYRWEKKIRRTVDAVSCESGVPEERESDSIKHFAQEPTNIDSSVEDGEESTSAHLLESAVASSSSDEYYLQGDAFVFTDNCCSNSCASFLNESESTAFEEPALFANEKSKEDQTTTFADDYIEEIEIPEEEIEINRDKSEDPLVKYAEKPLYTGSRLTLGISMLLIVTFAIRHGHSGVGRCK